MLDSSLTLSDADNTTLAGATVSITSGFFAGDTLNFTNQNGISGSYDSGTGVLTLTRQRLGGQLPDGAALDHLLLDQRQPDQLRRQYQPHDQLDGQRRRLEQHAPPPAR